MKKPYNDDDLDKLRPGQALHFSASTIDGDGNERHHLMLAIATTEEGIHTGRRRYLVGCTSCNALMHDATTGTELRVMQHLGVQKWEPGEPPAAAITRAIMVGAASPCAKSKRGVVVFDRAGVIQSVGHNGPPVSAVGAFACDGSDACKRDCAKICAHAEERAIRQMPVVSGLDLLHVKVVRASHGAYRLVAGDPPSCWQCSRTIVDAGCRGVWLYENRATLLTDRVCGEPGCPKPLDHAETFYGQLRGWCEAHTPWSGHREFHDIDSGGSGLTLCDKHRGIAPTWVYYTAKEFHETTLKNCGLHIARLP